MEEVGEVMHACEGDLVCSLTHTMIPFFNASIFLDKNTKIGKVDEVFGRIDNVLFTVKPDEGVHATSFQRGDKVAIDPTKLLPLARFTNPPPSGGRGKGGGGKGGGRKGGKGGKKGAKGRGSPRGRGGRGRGRY